ncbi:type IA DNA topoisomerase [Alkaliphilus sp. B6464]|uniref:type IA DNA topoisomerase n=1 Tax=Alkaliphilus sp. B6464 TaxID=2731219 RepID=UPI001BAA381A|nr:type IA DNA topoisomerase [Alkaliphilus sp. B6464]QUH22013.1 topoisomerase DNA-binding C4 zinc finger domain-containing protein [Alkaliphilus sp. B6464]
MKKLIVAEKPKVALMLAANGRKILGDFKLNGKLITKDNVLKETKQLEQQIKRVGFVENNEYIISFAQGHLVELYQAYDYDQSYKNWRNIPDNFIPNPFKTKVIKGKEGMFNNLEKLMKSTNVSEIINACDSDREGNSIFSIIYTQANCRKPVKRLWTDEHTEKDIIKAFNEMKDGSYYENLTTAGYCRMTSDWILGALLTAKATVELSGGKEILNVGRVQTAVLSEIVRIEELNKNFKSQKYYQVVAKFKTKEGTVYEGVYEENFDDPKKADDFGNVLKNKVGKINNYNVENKNNYSPPLFDQTSLAIYMAKIASLDPDKTLDATQSLYESGHTTYPRTASNYITKSKADDFAEMYSKIASINPFAKKHSFNKNNKRIVDDSKVSSHPAIIPTAELPLLSRLSFDEKMVYEEIVKRAISVNFPAATDRHQTILTGIDGFLFKSTGKKEIEQGWREVYSIITNDTSLPEVKNNEEVSIIGIEKKEVKTQPPKRYTIATIIEFMESCGRKIKDEDMRQLMKEKGIGTGATRANILKGLQDHGYATTKGKSKTLYPTEKGERLINILPVDELKNAEFTGEMEFKLSKVEKGQVSKDEYMKDVVALYNTSISKLKKTDAKIVTKSNGSVGKCPLCESDIVKRKGKFGDFYGCTGWNNGCKFTINKVCGKLLTENQASILLEKGETARVSGLKKKDGSKLPSAKFVLNKQTGEVTLDFN